MSDGGSSDTKEGVHLRTLSEPPAKTWPDGVLHHGVRILLLFLAAVVITVLYPPVSQPEMARYDLGTVVEEDVIAQVPFAVPKTPQALERDRAEAAAAVPPTFEYHPGAADSVEARLDRFFQRVDSAAAGGGTEGVRRVLSEASIVTSPAQTRLITDSLTLRLLRRTALRAAREILPQGVMDASQAQNLTTDRIVVREEGERERTVAMERALSARDFYDRAVEMLPASAAPDLSDLLRLILIRFMEPTYVLDPVATDLDKDAARSSVPTTKASVLAGEAIVRANQQVGQAELERLRAYEEHLRTQGLLEEAGVRLAPFAGATLMNLLLLATFGLLLYFFRTEIYLNFRWVLVLELLILAYFGIGAVIVANEVPDEALPVAFVALTVAVLWDGRLALVLALLLAGVTGLQPPFADAGTVALTMVGGGVAALSVRVVRRRVQTWVFGLVIAGAYAAGILFLGMVEEAEPLAMVTDMAWAGGNAMLSAIVAMSFVPVFEKFTSITTDQTLLEWADPNQDLLKRLSLEAPGTYAHTIQVANLAEAAANAVGANGLLCRVGLYYHDVGKMLKPQYFVENQPGGRNPHDKLKPSTSAAIVREHVTEGLRLAQEERLPEVITAFILEHHGTQKIGFFLEKAREEEGGEEIDLKEFSYPGPRPRSKETAIAMLADSVESATRALQDPNPERIRNLIDRIVEGKIQDGQLDESPLTLREIARIKEQFAKVLGGIYHQRLDYPATRHLTSSETPVVPEGGVPVPGGSSEEGPGGAEGPEEEEESPEPRTPEEKAKRLP